MANCPGGALSSQCLNDVETPPNLAKKFGLLSLDPTQRYKTPTQSREEFLPGQVAALEYMDGTKLARFIILDTTEKITIGRDRGTCDLALPHNGQSGISSKHMEIYHDRENKESRFSIIDISCNGIAHNNIRPDKGVRLPLYHRDVIRIGNIPETIFTFQDAAALPTGIHLHYDIRKKIGCGNFSEVMLGVSRRNGNKYAVKVLDRKRFEAFSAKRNSHLDFGTEMNTLCALKHTNIVRYFECIEEGDLKYLVTEFLEGGDLLQKLLDDGKYADDGTKRVFVQILEGLKYLHSRRIVHRDLKPENVLLTNRSETPTAKIGDFGLARILPQVGHGPALFQTFCGTPHYFAPELIQSQQGQCKGYGQEVDLWSAGVILYILLSGSPPFEDENLYQQILSADYVFDEEWKLVSQPAKQLVRHLMQVDPTKRYSVTQALQHEFLANSVPSQKTTRARSRSPKNMKTVDINMRTQSMKDIEMM